jgi:hypothetical protein
MKQGALQTASLGGWNSATALGIGRLVAQMLYQ